MNFINLASRLLGFDTGRIVLGHGRHRKFVPTCLCPSKVYVSVDGEECGGCGNAPLNTWSVSFDRHFKGCDKCGHENDRCETHRCHGFTLSIDVQTEVAVVDWIVKGQWES